MAYSVMLVIVPLLPAFTVKRRLLEPSARLEASGFAALGCRRGATFQDVLKSLIAAQFTGHGSTNTPHSS